jgi:hypothetical protein
MARRPFSDGSRGDEQLVRQLPALLRQHRPDLMEGEKLYRSPPGFTSWSGHWAKAVAVELGLGAEARCARPGPPSRRLQPAGLWLHCHGP